MIIEYDDLLNKLDFWTYIHTDQGYNILENSMIGASKGSSLIKKYIDSIVQDRTIKPQAVLDS